MQNEKEKQEMERKDGKQEPQSEQKRKTEGQEGGKGTDVRRFASSIRVRVKVGKGGTAGISRGASTLLKGLSVSLLPLQERWQ